MKKILIIDYNAGNLFSVVHACKKIGLEPFVSSNKNDFKKADAAILPGVGAFAEAMKSLQELDLVHSIKDFIKEGKQFMGICLGLQLLFTESNEFEKTEGLDIIKGEIKKFPTNTDSETFKVPHVGWNRIIMNNKIFKKSPLKDIKDKEYMYFVHSYYAKAIENDLILTKTQYAEVEFTSSILKDNIFATQFHPEKSGEAGLSIYKNWIKSI